MYNRSLSFEENGISRPGEDVGGEKQRLSVDPVGVESEIAIQDQEEAEFCNNYVIQKGGGAWKERDQSGDKGQEQ